MSFSWGMKLGWTHQAATVAGAGSMLAQEEPKMRSAEERPQRCAGIPLMPRSTLCFSEPADAMD